MVNTLSISRQLQEAGISRKEADAIATQMGQIVESNLVNKQDLKEVELGLQKEIKEADLSLQKEIEKVRTSVILWVAGLLIAQGGVIITLLKVL